MYRNGLAVGQIAELCGAVRETVGRHLRVQRAGFPYMQAEHESNRPPARPPAKPGPTRLSLAANVHSLTAILEAEGQQC